MTDQFEKAVRERVIVEETERQINALWDAILAAALASVAEGYEFDKRVAEAAAALSPEARAKIMAKPQKSIWRTEVWSREFWRRLR